MKNLRIKIILLCLLFNVQIIINAQAHKVQAATIMFYNVENLYDTIKSADVINGYLSPDDPKYQISIPETDIHGDSIGDLKVYKGELSSLKLQNKKVIRRQFLTDEFYYKGTKLWNSKKYNEKIKNISKVIAETGKKETSSLPVIIGLAEIENEFVLKDLCKELSSLGSDYSFSHFNSFDARGVDVALLYNERFILQRQKKIPIYLRGEKGYRIYTRDILLTEGLLDGEKMYFFVNHWPSRRGGEKKSLPRRITASQTLKRAMDSILVINPEAKMIAMGDFNDDPTSPSIKNVFNISSSKEKVTADTYFNPAEKLFKQGIGTLAYDGSFNFFDQQIFSPYLVLDRKGYYFHQLKVFTPSYLITHEGPYKGYPFRSFEGNNYTGGYSDHYPVYSILIRNLTE